MGAGGTLSGRRDCRPVETLGCAGYEEENDDGRDVEGAGACGETSSDIWFQPDRAIRSQSERVRGDGMCEGKMEIRE